MTSDNPMLLCNEQLYPTMHIYRKEKKLSVLNLSNILDFEYKTLPEIKIKLQYFDSMTIEFKCSTIFSNVKLQFERTERFFKNLFHWNFKKSIALGSSNSVKVLVVTKLYT